MLLLLLLLLLDLGGTVDKKELEYEDEGEEPGNAIVRLCDLKSRKPTSAWRQCCNIISSSNLIYDYDVVYTM